MKKHNSELAFTTSTNEILQILIRSKENGNVIGISSPSLGAGIFLTAVDKVIFDYEVVVQLKSIDVNGGALEKNTLKLTDISTVCAFKSRFVNLYHEQANELAPLEVFSY